ncbi:hypothetical protein D3C87_1790120 [compost metagenome]
MGADIATADAVAFRLALRHVESLAQSLDNFRQPDMDARHELNPVEVMTISGQRFRTIERILQKFEIINIFNILEISKFRFLSDGLAPDLKISNRFYNSLTEVLLKLLM